MKRIPFLFLFVLPVSLFAQDLFKITLSGTIKDASTGDPLHYANVFLSNTGYGAATDSLGRFEIRSVPAGRYELVASMMGYEAQSRRIDLARNKQRIFQFRLEPIVLPGETVRISAPAARLPGYSSARSVQIIVSRGAASGVSIRCRRFASCTNPSLRGTAALRTLWGSQ